MSTKLIAGTAALAVAAATLVAAPAAEAVGRGVTHVHVTKKHTVVAASTLRPGMVHLRNDGSRGIAVFAKKHEGVAQLVKYMNAQSDRTAKKAFTRFGFVEILDSHADGYVRLARGHYYLVDVSANTIKAKGVRALTVRGKRSDAARPASTRTLRLSGNGTISGAATGSVRPFVRVDNRTSAARIVEALRVKPDATAAQVSDALAHPSSDKFYGLLDTTHGEPVSLLGFVGAHRDVTTRTALRAGRYFITAPSVFSSDAGFTHLRLLTIK